MCASDSAPSGQLAPANGRPLTQRPGRAPWLPPYIMLARSGRPDWHDKAGPALYPVCVRIHCVHPLCIYSLLHGINRLGRIDIGPPLGGGSAVCVKLARVYLQCCATLLSANALGLHFDTFIHNVRQTT